MKTLETIIDSHNMASNKTETIDLMQGSEYPEYFAIGVTWRNVTGTKNGTLKLYGTNIAHDTSDYVLLFTINITSAHNQWDKTQFVSSGYPFRELVMIYEKNGITGGDLYVDLYKRDL